MISLNEPNISKKDIKSVVKTLNDNWVSSSGPIVNMFEKKICKYLKKGGYLIFGDPNKSGGFQNMLQRYGLYKFSKNDDDVVKNSEILFKEDIDRSEKAVPRTRKEIK